MRRFKRHQLRLLSQAAVFGQIVHAQKSIHAEYLHRKHLIRLEAGLVGLIILSGILLQTFFTIKPPSYNLDPKYRSLVGESRDDTEQYLTKSKDGTAYEFAVPETASGETSEHTGRNEGAYSASFATDPQQGVSFTDTQTEIAIKMVPKFYVGAGQKVEGDHIVYPMGANKLVYTLKYNGIKEDIIVPSFQGDDLSYDFELVLPNGVEARLDKQGNIGLYSADKTLYGNITYGSDEDQALVDNARDKGEKTNLVAVIPHPIVKDATGQEYTDKANFTLGNMRTVQSKQSANHNVPAEVQVKLESKTTQHVYDLKLNAKNLKDLTYPISLDPTMQSTSAADFTGVNNEGGIEIDNSGLIKRGNLTGGSVGSWSSNPANDMPQSRNSGNSTIYNGYLYVAANDPDTGSSAAENIIYAKLDANGEVSSAWSSEITLPIAVISRGFFGYNGYLYTMGGGNSNGSYNNVHVAKINPTDGSLGAWVATTSLPFALQAMGIDVYDGYVYITGGVTVVPSPFIIGEDDRTFRQTVYSAPVHGDGTLGTWSIAGSNFTVAARGNPGGTIYNGNLYIVGGCDSPVGGAYNCNNTFLDGQYVPITGGGTIGTWVNLPSLPSSTRAANGIEINNGFITFLAGNGNGSNYIRKLVYAPIYMHGNIGNWQSQDVTLQINRYQTNIHIYNNKYLVIGGVEDSSVIPLASIETATINPAGAVATFADSGNVFTNPRFDHGSAVYSGYIYVVGGCSVTNCPNSDATTGYLADVRYAQIQSNGTLGTWNNTTALPATGSDLNGHKAGRRGIGVAAYNGRLYVIGGQARNRHNSSASYKDDVIYATIGATGSLGGSWTSASATFSASRWRHTAIADQGRLYIVGGHANDQNDELVLTGSDQVQVGVIDMNNGNITSFADGPELNTGRIRHASVIAQGYLYIVGGFNHPTYLNSIERAQINANGTLGAWTTTGNTPFTNARRLMAAYVNKNKLYITAGHDATTFYSDLQSADIAYDGTIGSWTTSSSSLASGRYGAGMVIYGDRAYVTGGCTAGTLGVHDSCDTGAFLNTTRYATINNGGSGATGTWSDTNQQLAQRNATASVVYKDKLYVFGGCNTTAACALAVNYMNTVQYTTFQSDGTLSAWSSGPSLLSARIEAAAAVIGEYVYLIGGENSSQADLAIIEYARFNSDGTLSSNSCGTSVTWCSTTSFPNSVSRHTVATYNGYMYVVAGYQVGAASTTTRYAQQTSNGTLAANSGCGSTWCTTSNLNVARYGHGGAVHRDKVYVLSGFSDASGLSVEFATFQSNGTISAWSKTTDLARHHRHTSAVAYNGFIYLVAGQTSAPTTHGTVQYAPILSSGHLGTWQITNSLAQGQLFSSSAAYNGYLYAFAGTSSTNRTQYASLQSTPRIGHTSRLYDFDVGVKPTKLITRGTKQTNSSTTLSYMNTNNAATTWGSTTTISDIGYTGANALSLSHGSNVTLSRYLFLRYTIDDTNSAVFPDSGSESTITDFDLYYTSNPGMRLRNGRTFTNGANRGLQASPQ